MGKIPDKRQRSLFDEEKLDGQSSSDSVCRIDSSPDNRRISGLRVVFTDGADCPVPVYFPTTALEMRHVAQCNEFLKNEDWEGLRRIRCRWWCLNCTQWHEFSQRFFDEYEGLYPYELTRKLMEELVQNSSAGVIK